MPKKRFSSEQIITKLRQIEVQLAQGKSIALACKDAAISEQSYFRWRQEYGGLQIEQAKRLKDLERENARLRRLVADLSNGYCESFNGKFRDECLRLEIFSSLKEAQVVIGAWQDHYNRVRPHSSLG